MQSARVLFFILLLAALPSAGQDCDCARVGAPCSAYWDGAAVFVGRVESVARETAARRVRFTLLERFRGPSSSTVDVLTGPSGQRCSLAFKVGREYLVYASRVDGGLFVPACSRTRDVEDAAADLAYARGLKDGTTAAGRITGQVLRGRRDLNGKTSGPSEPMAGVTVRVARDGAGSQTITNHAGDFVVASAGAGKYDVRVDVPDGYYSDDSSSIVELGDARGCADVSATFYSNAVVAGRVVDASARPVPGLTIEIATASLSQRRKTITDRDGRYEITRLPAGRFVVGVNTGLQKNAAPVKVFHPGVDKIASATRVALGQGQRVTLDDLRIPSHITFVAVSGFVLDADGTAAEGARVYLRGVAEGDHIVAEPALVDFLGRFVIAALSGVEYEIFAERSRSPRTDSTEPLRLTVGEGMKPLRLVLRRRY
ncbi:MAG TPA: carboxypeptidase regulatory-like domain-containing protein [Vicinamibacterales bacterium]